ncbi:hypothetical protein N7G274_007230 [Stereocaulon virgatum]|uniref:Cellulase n=1 Tax=Stereocaulon virgatum TaxID=373712 RepID=A0ABR4A1T0_9LECA
MLSFSLFLLLTSTQFPSVQSAARRKEPRQGAVALWSPCHYPSEGINEPLPCAVGSCICKDSTYSQCRTQDPTTGSWSGDPSWQCQAPGQSPTGGTVPSTGGSTAQPNAASTDSNTGARIGQAQQSTAQKFAVTNPLAGSNGDTTTPGTSINATQTSTKGDCGSTRAPSGWDGVASTSFYQYTGTGTACDCPPSATWQWSGGRRSYSGAVNNIFFDNNSGSTNCGSGCGTCYQLMTSGYNYYEGDTTTSGSMMTLNIVDSCWAGDGSSAWCPSTQAGFTDQAGCGVHFDVMTAGPGFGASGPIGNDGQSWDSPIVYYKKVLCDSTFSRDFQQCTCGKAK